jgi:hypothetical protein
MVGWTIVFWLDDLVWNVSSTSPPYVVGITCPILQSKRYLNFALYEIRFIMYVSSLFSKAQQKQKMGPKKYNTWEKDNMMRAIMAVRNKEMGLVASLENYTKCQNQL